MIHQRHLLIVHSTLSIVHYHHPYAQTNNLQSYCLVDRSTYCTRVFLWRMRQDGEFVGSPANLPDVRGYALLRFIAEQTRYKTFSPDGPSGCCIGRTGGAVVMVLCRWANNGLL